MEYDVFEKDICLNLRSFLLLLPEEIVEKSSYVLGGHHVRSRVIYEICRIVECSPQGVLSSATLIETIHSVSILQDDIIDQEVERRLSRTLNNYLSSKHITFISVFLLNESIEFFLKSNERGNFSYIISKMRELCEGEIMQDLKIDGRDHIETYLKINLKKTGALFALSFTLPSLIKKQSTQEEIALLEEMGYLYGLFFQVRDDLKDLLDDTSKPFGESSFSHIKSIPSILWKNIDEASYLGYLQKKIHTLPENVSKKIQGESYALLRTSFQKLKDKVLPLQKTHLDRSLHLIEEHFSEIFNVAPL